MSERFFSSVPICGEHVTLDGAEAHHLQHVMRCRTGDAVTLFDGSGAEFSAVVESMARAEVALRVLERREVDRELAFALAVGVALPKGDRQKWLAEKLTELGVTTLVPLVTERGVAQPSAAALERLRRAVIEAAKQCGRNRLLRIGEPQTWNEWLETGGGFNQNKSESRSLEAEIDQRRLVAHPGGISLSKLDSVCRLPAQLAIGPEGGLTEAEVAASLAAGWQAVDLGRRVLRVETAAVALAAALALR